jgi:hypothetical protein
MFPRPRPIPFVAVAVASLALVACSGSTNRWGYARQYAPTPAEKDASVSAKELDAPMAQLKPEEWRGKKVVFYMIVSDRKDVGAGAYLTGKLHVRNEINQCSNFHDEDSCRVTIKPGEHDVVHVAVPQMPVEDNDGELRVTRSSLVRVVGTLREKVDADDGKLVIDASWYRQWPYGYYALEGDLRQ